MDPSSDSTSGKGAKAERKLLCALCQPELDGETRGLIVRRLQSHRFTDSDYEVIYRALSAMPARSLAQSELARAVTRLGFPDMDLEWLFTKAPATRGEIQALLDAL